MTEPDQWPEYVGLLAVINGLVDALVTAQPEMQDALAQRWRVQRDALAATEATGTAARVVEAALTGLQTSARALQRLPPVGLA